MQAIEFETIARHHLLQVPDQVPDGVKLRVLVLIDETSPQAVSVEAPDTRARRKPSLMLAGSVVLQDDLLAPAAPESDWNALQ
ncbi:hypothetical protein [uncultured Thiocystis sp.]|jgi:hypothetical protein|uniref:hypothetical protein n=1 Tax=uncultured Thiocystis sp. TaxID=1202134 RepID=UPI0025F31783|nr:hypothetical protein [uncultured Thiocystis sp.]